MKRFGTIRTVCSMRLRPRASRGSPGCTHCALCGHGQARKMPDLRGSGRQRTRRPQSGRLVREAATRSPPGRRAALGIDVCTRSTRRPASLAEQIARLLWAASAQRRSRAARQGGCAVRIPVAAPDLMEIEMSSFKTSAVLRPPLLRRPEAGGVARLPGQDADLSARAGQCLLPNDRRLGGVVWICPADASSLDGQRLEPPAHTAATDPKACS